ncbi:hypothetical protein [Desulfonatronum sp. SC1]|uniref:hypothetical protein n=1 Tax=Desulfonatronum sp. SC1 TaxID=2109626 RepID=UPI000D31F49A|nr:hypothetical protein [Desulfonatronum sp. SC1]PTN32856.1 hypothetical protein C6366_15510 [Desulfonatronum sp. SC1]
MEYIVVFLTYLSKATERLKQEDYEHALTMLPQGGKDIMNTLADQWMRRGWDEGKIEGRSEGQVEGVRSTILDLVLAKFDHIPMGLTGKLSAIEDLGALKGLSVSLIKADSLEAFLAHLDKAAKPDTQ